MKTHIIFLVLIYSTLTGFSQPNRPDNMRDARGRERIKAAHAAYITQRLELTPEEAEKFWPVYREYNEKRMGIRQELRDGKSDTDQKDLLDLDLEMRQKELDLEKEYARRFEKIISPEKVLKLRQAELDFRKLVLRQIQHRRRR